MKKRQQISLRRLLRGKENSLLSRCVLEQIAVPPAYNPPFEFLQSENCGEGCKEYPPRRGKGASHILPISSPSEREKCFLYPPRRRGGEKKNPPPLKRGAREEKPFPSYIKDDA